MDLKALSNKILERRKKLGLSQHALAERAGVSRAYISLIERAQAENVSGKILSRLAAALATTSTVLIGEAEQLDEAGAYIPPSLIKFAQNEHLSFDAVNRLVRIPRPENEPQTVEEWQKLYDAVRPYLEKTDWLK